MVNIDDNSSIVLMFNKISGWNIIPNKADYKGEYLLGESQSKTPDFQLMQFTGLHDKNGREIYDGDILTSLGKDVCVVKYKSELCGYFLEFYDANLDQMDFMKLDFNTVKFREVVGNVHETPELLKR